MSMRLVLVVGLLTACRHGGGKGPVAGVADDARASDPPATPRVTGKPARPEPTGECRRDDDCVLLPVLSCCGECPPSPPFEAAPLAELDAALIENEEQCAVEDTDAACFPCDPVPAGCVAHAACVDTRCTVAAEGCPR